MARDIEVHIDFAAGLKRAGTLHRHARRGTEALSFEYAASWLADPARFSLEPALTLGRGAFAPAAGQPIFGSIGDSAPDTWGRRLMQRAERRRAEAERRPVRTLMEADYLLGVADVSRTGALRLRYAGETAFEAQTGGVPPLVALGRLLKASERVLRDEESAEDLQIIFAPGSSLGGARPKASIMDSHGRLSIAKFPKETDDRPVELWEHVALTLAAKAGIGAAQTELIKAAGKWVLLSRRFDRAGATRIPYLSALAMMGLKDGDRASYPEIVDVLTQHGASAAQDARELFRRMAFNVLVSNVDDHLRNHGFLWLGKRGWRLSPAFDVNPVPADERPRILTTNITADDGTCDVALVLSVAPYFNLKQTEARAILSEVATVTRTWRDAAAQAGARAGEIKRMASAFEHADLTKALAM